MFIQIEQWLISLANKLSLEVFAFLASIVEEVIPPIPSPAVMIIVGSAALVQDYVWPGLVLLVVLASLGKTIGGLVVYVIVDKLEDVAAPRFAKFFGVSHQQIESFGQRFSRDWKDYLLLALLRALPVIPSAIISVACGAIKVPKNMFASATFVGSLVRNAIYIYVGFVGTEFLSFLADRSTNIESVIEAIILVAAAMLLIWAWRRRKSKIVVDN